MSVPARRNEFAQLLDRRKKDIRREDRLKDVLERVLQIPIENLPWPELSELFALNPQMTLMEAAHMSIVRKAAGGDVPAYKAIIDIFKLTNAAETPKAVSDYLAFLDEHTIDVTPTSTPEAPDESDYPDLD